MFINFDTFLQCHPISSTTFNMQLLRFTRIVQHYFTSVLGASKLWALLYSSCQTFKVFDEEAAFINLSVLSDEMRQDTVGNWLAFIVYAFFIRGSLNTILNIEVLAYFQIPSNSKAWLTPFW